MQNNQQQLQLYKKSCNEILDNLRKNKKVDKDAIEQINYNISKLGCDINNLLLNYGDENSEQDSIAELLYLYEKATQHLDQLIYKHKDIHQHLRSGFKSQIQNQIDQTPLSEIRPMKDISQFSSFQFLQKLNILEDNNVEFKNYTLSSMRQNQAKYIFKKTIVSFLNRDGGCIYLGIRDDSTVVGMRLNHAEMDWLKRRFITIKAGICPQMNEKVKVDYIPIKQGSKWYKGHWVVRIRVSQGDLNTLYYHNNTENPYQLESYFREDGAVIKYKINDFIEERITISSFPRVEFRKDYCAPDVKGVNTCMIQADEQNHHNKLYAVLENRFEDFNISSQQQQKYNNNYVERKEQNHFSSNKNSNRYEQIEVEEEEEESKSNHKPLKPSSDPFTGIQINENELNSIVGINDMHIQNMLLQDAGFQKNQSGNNIQNQNKNNQVNVEGNNGQIEEIDNSSMQLNEGRSQNSRSKKKMSDIKNKNDVATTSFSNNKNSNQELPNVAQQEKQQKQQSQQQQQKFSSQNTNFNPNLQSKNNTINIQSNNFNEITNNNTNINNKSFQNQGNQQKQQLQMGGQYQQKQQINQYQPQSNSFNVSNQQSVGYGYAPNQQKFMGNQNNNIQQPNSMMNQEYVSQNKTSSFTNQQINQIPSSSQQLNKPSSNQNNSTQPKKAKKFGALFYESLYGDKSNN